MKQQQRHRIILFIVIGWLICLLRVPSLLALEVPPLKQRVNDTANMLSASTKQQLEEILGRLEQTDSTQIVLLTIPSLGGEVLEEFSIKVADQWKIGQKGLDNGAILLIAKNDRKIRIEVGYGLEGSLTDLMAGRIIRNVIVPKFKAGNFDQGVIDGVQAMIGVARGEYQAPENIPSASGSKVKGTNSFFVVGVIAFIFIIIIFISILGILSRFFGHGHSQRSHWGAGWSGGFGGGGFSSGGFSGGGGGFSGGGGGFGGGGASGGW
jgi:uncharacterized protein